jgi:gamma-glutamylcysteine synthetase
VWDSVFGSNRHIPPERGDDFHLFTVNTASHVHVNISWEKAARAINALNGFVGAQIALTADSSVWRGEVDPHFQCASEKLWDKWMPDSERVGLPERPFDDMRDYVHQVAELKPVYVRREGQPIVLDGYESFAEYYAQDTAVGTDSEGNEVEVQPREEDIELHNSCYWFNTRLSRHNTVENRANDQQPPGELLSVAALTAGVVTALPEAEEELESHDWSEIQASREAACRDALEGRVESVEMTELARRLLEVAETGLKRRGHGEEEFLAPLRERLRKKRAPSVDAAELHRRGGVRELVKARSI